MKPYILLTSFRFMWDDFLISSWDKKTGWLELVELSRKISGPLILLLWDGFISIIPSYFNMVRLILLDSVGFGVEDNTKTKGCNLRLEHEFYLKVHRPIQLTLLGWQLCNGNRWRNSVFFGLYFYGKKIKITMFYFFLNKKKRKKKKKQRIIRLGQVIPILDMSTSRASKNLTLNSLMDLVKICAC